ncbi:MAG: Purine catabolism regulatory protein-like family [Tepidanaerobacteraceae bacterium]|nr:Purine catabolism regulatory protein-like family [Tepidanaerobacteraceae bacterium]
MGICVGEALKLKGLDKAKLIAGEKGIDRLIKRVSVIECPESPECWSLLKYKKGILALMSFGNESNKSIDLRIEAFSKTAERVGGNYKLGIGNLHPALSEINLCIEEALLACDLAKINGG